MPSLRELLGAWLSNDVQSAQQLNDALSNESESVRSMAAFVLHLAGKHHDADLAPATREVLEAIENEMSAEPIQQLVAQAISIAEDDDPRTARRALWTVFCPSASDLDVDPDGAVEEILRRRRLDSATPAARPIAPGSVLLTSNVMLTVPTSAPAGGAEHWFDHPIPLDADPNEIAHGIGGLDAAVGFEIQQGVIHHPVPVVLSVSATHPELETAGVEQVRQMLDRPAHLSVHLFDEQSAGRLLTAAIGPALDRLGRPLEPVRRVFGVSGAYGRHYSFLKAMAAVWHVLVDQSIEATFKIDLDQVFAQEELVADCGRSAFEILADPRWGGSAIDAAGREVSLDFVAGALVNEVDIHNGLHIADVKRPTAPPSMEQRVSFPSLAQAVSTEAEMTVPGLRQRVHITGGTTGATVHGLRRLRPFTPTFWGRAEDQAYALSHGRETVSLHLHDLVMRHDNSTFTTAAVPGASVAKVIGDQERILLFSAYARHLGVSDTVERLWPFTSAFISPAPVTTAYMKLATTVLGWAEEGRLEEAEVLARNGLQRLSAMRRFAAESFAAELDADRTGWNDLYDALDLLESALQAGEEWATEAGGAARRVVESTLL